MNQEQVWLPPKNTDARFIVHTHQTAPGTQSDTISKSTKHMQTGRANYHDLSSSMEG